MTSIHK